MRPLDPVANAKSSLSAARERFEALTSAEQVTILALVWSFGVGGNGIAKTPRQTSHELAAEAIKNKQLPDPHDSEVVVTQPRPESEQHGANDLRALAAAAQIQIDEYDVLAEHSESESSSH